MLWNWTRRSHTPLSSLETPIETPKTRCVNSPGLAIVLSGLPEDGAGRILDLSAASVANLGNLMAVSSHVRVVDSLQPEDPNWQKLTELPDDEGPDPDLKSATAALFPKKWGEFDLVLAWDLLNYLTEDGFTALVDRLAILCRPQARMLLQIVVMNDMAIAPARYKIVKPDQVEISATTGERRTAPAWPSAKIERLLSGFEIEHSFVMRHGVNEYVALKT